MSGCDECVLGRQRKRGQPSEVERQGPQACLSLGPGYTGVFLNGPCAPLGRMPLSAEPAKVTSALINLINKTVHQGGHYLLIGDDSAGRSCPGGHSDSPTSCGPSGPKRSTRAGRGAGGGAGAAACRLHQAGWGDPSQSPHRSPLQTACAAYPGRPLPAPSLPLTPSFSGVNWQRAHSDPAHCSGPGRTSSFAHTP